MARWRLLAPHYLNVEGIVWEYKEVDRSTGKQVRRNFPVPQHLHPDDPADWNYKYGKDEGEVIVSDGHNADPKDIVFSGAPTPDMLPLDDEAKAISEKYASAWRQLPEALPGTYSQSLIDNMQREMAELEAKTEAKPIKIEGLDQVMATMAKVMEQNAAVISALSARRPVSA